MANWRWAAGFILAAFGTLLVAACTLPAVDPAAETAAQKVFDAVRHSDAAAFDAIAAPPLKTDEARAGIASLRQYIPNSEPRGHKTIGWSFTALAGGPTTLLVSDEYDFGDHIVLSQVTLVRQAAADPWLAEGINIRAASLHELAANRFWSPNKKFDQFAFLAATIASPLLMIWALVKVIRRKGLRRKWLWGILAFGGLCSFQMNWWSGQMAANLLTVQIIGAGVTRAESQFAPWILTMTLPIGALLILTGVWANPKRARPRPVDPALAFGEPPPSEESGEDRGAE